TVVTPGASGANQTWDFGSLTQQTVDTVSAVDPANTPFATDFSSSNLALINSNSGVPLYMYFSNNSSGLFQDGEAGDLTGLGIILSVMFNPQNEMLEFPSTYSTSFSSNYSFDIKQATTIIPLADSARLKEIETKISVI